MLNSARPAARLVLQVAPLDAVATIALGLLSGLAIAPSSWLTKQLLDELTRPGSSALRCGVLAAGAALLVGLATAAAYAAGITSTRLATQVQIETETQLAQACASFVGTSFLDDPQQQDQLHLAQRGAHDAPELVTNSVVECFSSLSAIGGFVVLLAVSWPLMLLATFATAVPAALIQRSLSRRAIDTAERTTASYRWRDYYAELFATPATARDLRLSNAQELFTGRLRHHLSIAVDQERKQQSRAAWLQIIFTGLSAVIAATGAVVVAVGVSRGHATVGDFVLFTAAVAVVQARVAGLLKLSGAITFSLGVFENYQRFVANTAANKPARALAEAGPLTSAIEFRDIWFRYRDDADWVLRGLNLKLEAGRTHALVGVNGAGKSSIVKLLFRLYEPTSGQILWNGTDVCEFDPASLRRRLAGVLQDFAQYEMTALENITLGDLECLGDSDRALRAADAAGASAIVAALPLGLDTMLSTRRAGNEGAAGTTLSGGQWQRIALARAMMRQQADLLVLDEANSGMDAAAENELHQRLRSFGRGRTQLLISHRLGGARSADHIMTISEGRIVEQGSHDELIDLAGLYARLYQLQAAPFVNDVPVGTVDRS